MAGKIVEGEVRSGMVLLPRLVQHPNVYYALPILAVEAVTHPGGISEISLVIQEGGAPGSVTAPAVAPGTLLDVLERAPAA